MSKVKYVLFENAYSAKIAETEVPEPDENQTVIRTLRSLISPGTELAYFEGRHTDFKTGKTKFPRGAPGYSAVGIIEKAGNNLKGFKEGDRVLAMSGHAEKGRPSSDNLTAIPDGLDSDYAVCGILGSIALHGVREANIQFGANVLILGMGMIGQIALRLARLSPARNIIAADMYPIRLDAAKHGGADHCVNLSDESLKDAVDTITAGRECDTIIEASGNTAAIATALKCAANRGKIVILGCPHGIAELDLYMELQKREITLVGSYQPNCPQTETGYTPWTQQKNRELILEYLNRGKLDFSKIITHKMPYEKAPELYNLLSQHKDQAIGAVIDWENK
ncbi:MAG: hypothetical protein A2017_05245 [Lentisphaerae bacterium GWF2_44_16]|nr:MAG: hypothetical protein A2017_05245 [Lentisphaerae bacterium GWF2_44_16]